MSDRTTDEVSALTGQLQQVPQGTVPYVGIVPDNYLPPLRYEGGASGASVAGGAGFRSEVLIIVASKNQKIGYEITDLKVACITAAQQVEIVKVAAASGFTDAAFISGDIAAGAPLLQLQTKNTAAATTSAGGISRSIHCLTASSYVSVPGIFRLRGDQTGIIIRPTTDNIGIRVMFAWKELQKRSL